MAGQFVVTFKPAKVLALDSSRRRISCSMSFAARPAMAVANGHVELIDRVLNGATEATAFHSLSSVCKSASLVTSLFLLLISNSYNTLRLRIASLAVRLLFLLLSARSAVRLLFRSSWRLGALAVRLLFLSSFVSFVSFVSKLFCEEF